MPLITTTHSLAEACERLARHPFVTVDTEFLRETTYYPKLCLIQVASDEEAVLIDPLAKGIDLSPFFALMSNPDVVKVFHSSRQDLEIVWNLARLIPAPLFDTQVAAMVCGYGDSVSYEQLAADLAKAKIDKSSRFTDWSRRPLSEAQTSYALSDVTHLRTIYKTLRDRLQASGREAWLDEEMTILTSPSTYENHPEDAWQRLRGRIRKPKDLAIVMELAAWREREAQSRDIPRSRVLKDDALLDIALRAPQTPEDLSHLRALPQGFERSKAGAEVMAAVAAGLVRDPKSLPKLTHDRRRSNNGAMLDLLKVLLKAVAEEQGVAPKIIATTEDLEALAESTSVQKALLKGWRGEIFGTKALALMQGELGIGFKNNQVVVLNLEQPTIR